MQFNVQISMFLEDTTKEHLWNSNVPNDFILFQHLVKLCMLLFDDQVYFSIRLHLWQ